MPEPRLLGPLVRIQVQVEPLKVAGRYDTEPIVVVERAVLGPEGLIGRHGGSWLVDAHHGEHPRARGGGNRALSVGFTAHYAAMAERFGSAPLGVAGENLIVDTPEVQTLSGLGSGLMVRGADGAEVELGPLRVAAPCLEFTSFLLGRHDVAPRTVVGDDLEFLDGGMRGFIVGVSHLAGAVKLATGDLVYARV